MKGQRQQQEERSKNKNTCYEKRDGREEAGGRWKEATSDLGVRSALVAGMPYPYINSMLM